MDLTERITQAAAAQGMLASALPDAVARGTHAFTTEPTDDQLQQWAQSLRDVAPHFFPQPFGPDTEGTPPGVPPTVWKSMSASAKVNWAREHGASPPVVERRPKPVTLTPEQVRELASLPSMQRLTRYRELQDATQGRKA